MVAGRLRTVFVLACLSVGCAEASDSVPHQELPRSVRSLSAGLLQPIRPALRAGQRQRWQARAGGMSLFFVDGEIGITLPMPILDERRESSAGGSVEPGAQFPVPPPRVNAWGLHWSVDGASAVRPEVHLPHPARFNSYIGNDPRQWRQHIQGARELRYAGIRPGIDLLVGTSATGYSYRLHAEAAALPASLKLRYAGAQSIRVDDDGRGLTVVTGAGTVCERGLAVYQIDDLDRHVQRRAYYVADDDGAYRIVTEGLDPRWATVVDPVVEWTSYAGGSDFDDVASIAHAGIDRLVLGGTTLSGDYPSQGGFDSTLGGTQDAYLTAIIPSIPAIHWSTYVGGATGTDSGIGVAISGLGPVLVGSTNATDFPELGGFSTGAGTAPNGFAAAVAPDGGLRWSGYVGGNGTDILNDAAMAGNGVVYVAGTSSSTDLPTQRGFDTVGDIANDGYVASIASDGSQVMWGSYVGEAGADALNAIVLHPLGDLLIAGESESDMTLPNGFDTVRDGQDGLLLRIIASGSGILWGSYVGGSSWDRAHAVAFGPGGDLYVGGTTATAELATPGAYDTTLAGANDGFILEVDEATGSVVWATLLGGNSGNALNRDEIFGLAVDSIGRVYFAGFSNNPDFPTLGGLDDTLTQVIDGDGIAGQLSADGSTLAWATFLGGDAGGASHDSATCAILGPTLTFYVGGRVQSTDMVVTGGWDETRGGNQDGFLVAIADLTTDPPVITNVSANPASVDLNTAGSTTIACRFDTPRVGASAGDFGLTLRVRQPDDLTETVLCNATTNGSNCIDNTPLSIVGGPTSYTASMQWTPFSSMPTGLYDLACQIDDNVNGALDTTGFNANADALTLVGGLAICTPVGIDDGTCDGIDDDCDGTFDEDAAVTGECEGVASGPCEVPRCDSVARSCSVSQLTGCCAADVDCLAPSACVVGSCDLASNSCGLALPANCCATPSDCNDGNACTSERCDGSSGACVVEPIGGCCLSEADCDDGNACSLGSCAPSRRCSYTPTGCDSGTACGSDPTCTYAAVWLDRIEQSEPLPQLRRDADAAILGVQLRADALAGWLTALDVVVEGPGGRLPPGALALSLHAGGPDGPRLAEATSDPGSGRASLSGFNVQLNPAGTVRLWLRARPTSPPPKAALLLLAIGLALAVAWRGARRHALVALLVIGIGVGTSLACSRSGFGRFARVRLVIPSAESLSFDTTNGEVLEVVGAPVEGEAFDAQW